MPRRCHTCAHPDRAAIDRALAAREPLGPLAARYGLSRSSLARHAEAHIPEAVARAVVAVGNAAALDITPELARDRAHITLMMEACDRWLRDPEDPTRYDVGLRSDDVDVIYRERDGERWIRKRAKLSRLLRMVEGEDIQVDRGETKSADVRLLILKTIAASRDWVELVARIEGKIRDEVNLNVIASPEWARIQDRIVAALAGFPEARLAVAAALASLSPEIDA